MPKILKAIDVCCGAGGWAVAARGLPIQIIAAFDREEDSLATYKVNHPTVDAINCDILNFNFSAYRGIDLILGGIPCETLSVARNNRRAGRAELTAFKLLLARFLSLPHDLAARFFCYEEVDQVIPLLPPGTPYLKLSSADYSAQARTRIYIGNFPRPKPGECKAVLADHLLGGPHRISLRIFGKRVASRSGKSSKTFQPFYPDKKSFTIANFINSRRDAECAVPHELGWRNFDWKEGTTLQGFPADYLFVGNPGRTGKMIAQAVQIDTARELLKSICYAGGL